MKRTKNSPSENGRQNGKKAEGKGLRTYFVRLFGKYDFRNEKQFICFGKWLIFSLFLFVEGLIVLQQLDEALEKQKWWSFSIVLALCLALSVSVALKLFAIERNRDKVVFFVLDALMACGFVFFASGLYSLVIYMLVLTSFYLASDKWKFSVWLFALSMPLYAVIYGAQAAFISKGSVEIWGILRQALGSVVALCVHFVSVHIALAFYRQFLRLDKALNELAASKKELEKAYEVVAEVSALEERQRIAKDVHDTAGHSITTVIMQTEAARRLLESSPQDVEGVRTKLVAANLQAKHALEELRDSVHLLSGRTEKLPLKDGLLAIIRESTDGTGIVIRSDIDDIALPEETERFVCNTLKEGVSNGLRHGGATAFWFELHESDGKIEFLLSDNGRGASKSFALGFGLSAMQERANALGGAVTFETEEGEGFELRLTLPIERKE